MAKYTTDTTPFLPAPPWVPELAIIDAMFMVNVNPLRQHRTVEQYAYFLLRQFAGPHFHTGTIEVHLVFDHPGRYHFNPKDCEHQRRYGEKNKCDHTHITFTPQSTIPRPWREYIDCRECKRSLVEALGLFYLQKAASYLKEGQSLILAGCFGGNSQDDAWIITSSSLPESTQEFKSNAQEADMRIWRHAIQSVHQHVLIYSPDTDVYNIGIPLIASSKQYLVQTNLPHNKPQYINVNGLLDAFYHDPDL